MNVRRTINGSNGEKVTVQFALTAAEIELAFMEAQLKWDMDEIVLIYKGALSKRQLNIAAKVKRMIQDDDDGVGWREAIELAIDQCGYRKLIEAYERRG